MDVYRRREAILRDNLTQEDIEVLSERSPSEYGKTKVFNLEKVSGKNLYANCEGQSKSGRKVEVARDGKTIPYWVTESWCNPGMLRVNEAYRIVEQDDKTIIVKKVRDASELEEIAQEMKSEIRRILGR